MIAFVRSDAPERLIVRNSIEDGERNMKSAAFGLAACLTAGIAGAGWAQDLKATQKFADTQIAFEPGGAYGNYTLTITGPNGVHASVSSKTDVPSIDLRQIGAIEDGAYNYHLTASSGEKVLLRSRLDDGRDGGPPATMLKSVSMSGRFDVKGGAIVKYDPAAREEQKRQK
jgi:hypothetical protein